MIEETVEKPQLPSSTLSQIQKLLLLIKQNKTLALFLGFAILFAAGTTAYYFIAPSQHNQSQLFAPVRQEATLPPPSPTATDAPTPTLPLVTMLPSPTATPSPTPTYNPLAWITYPNVLYGYSVQYPPNWYVISLGELEPMVPNYVVFNPNTASTSAQSITISVSKRTFEQQLAIGGNGQNTSITVGGIPGTLQTLQDSDGNQSLLAIVPLTNTLLLFYSDTMFTTIFYQMLSSVKITN
ncbi:MAG: hypothetical protein AAB553_04380 [Patescibacteria group bacterium]